MVGGERAEFDGELRAPRSLELIGVELERQAVLPGGRQDGASLKYREHAGLAEHIAAGGQPLPRDGGNNFLAHPSHVLGAAFAVFGRDFVSAEKGGDERRSLRLPECANDAQLLELGLDVEAVPGLHLDRRAPVTQ